jgi:hypothetical protein
MSVLHNDFLERQLKVLRIGCPLISNRSNFLSNSLVRFEEVFLFSNEGDEVLRQISTTANYFSFPTKSNNFGYRLGNVCLLGLPYGINANEFNKSYLEIGKMRLSALYKRIEGLLVRYGKVLQIVFRISIALIALRTVMEY